MAEHERPKLGKMPTRTGAEFAVHLAEAALSAVPVVGGSASGVVEAILGPAMSRRKEAWFGQLGEALVELQERFDGFDPSALSENEQFVTTVLQTTLLALKTHQEEKHDAFRNAVVNSLLPGAPDDHEQMTFLRYLDELTPLHLSLLSFFGDPQGHFQKKGLPLPNFHTLGMHATLAEVFPDLAERQDMTDQVRVDLTARGLIIESPIRTTMRGAARRGGTVATFDPSSGRYTTPLGDAFLACIREPSGNAPRVV